MQTLAMVFPASSHLDGVMSLVHTKIFVSTIKITTPGACVSPQRARMDVNEASAHYIFRGCATNAPATSLCINS